MLDNDNTDPVNTDDNNVDNIDPTPNPDDINTSDDIIIYNDTPIYDDVDPLFPKTPEGQRDRDKARDLYRKGYDLYKENKYDEAKKAYLESLKYDDTYSYTYNNLGVICRVNLDFDTECRYYYKALEYDPLNKIIVDNLVYILKNKLNKPHEADKALQNHHEALQDQINNTTTKVTEIESLIDDTKLKQHAKQTENTLKKIKDSESKIDSIEVSLNKRIEELHAMSTTAENGTLAEYYQKKANDLREDLRGNSTWNSLGFIQKYWGMILIDIAVLLGFYSLTSMDFSTTPWKIKIPTNAWEILGTFLLTSPIMILLLWGTRYFNRRIHETVHLIEEYEHKAIVLKSFPSYSAQLKSLDTPEKTALLKYTEKVSHIITESPTHALTRKKTDKLPMEFVQALNQAHSKK